MKLTWFGGTTIRIHVGGSILVCDAAGISGVDPDELVSGADRVFSLGAGLEQVDPAIWQPERAASMLEEFTEVKVLGVEGGAIVSAPGDAPLLLLCDVPPRLGRWARDAVVAVFGARADELAAAVLEIAGPQLIAVAAEDFVVERAFAALKDRLQGTGLTSLDVGMALEV
jgi:hypothetical protein